MNRIRSKPHGRLNSSLWQRFLSWLRLRTSPNVVDRIWEAYEDGSERERLGAVAALAAERLSYEEFVMELSLLHLRDRPYSCHDYARNLSQYLGRSIEISVLSNAEFARPQQDIIGDDGSSFGRLVLIQDRDDLYIEVPCSLSPWLLQYTVFHELGHLAAGHPPRTADGVRLPPSGRQLARRPPLVSGLPQKALEDLYEAEADLRAEYAIITGSLGPIAVQTARLSQIS